MAVGESMGYSYTGSVVGVTLKKAGTYKLEVWGAQGGNSSKGGTGGLGGYSYGNYSALKDATLYVIVGQQGKSISARSMNSGLSYNGGGSGSSNTLSDNRDTYGGGGGGATHISTYNCGELKNCSSHKSNILIVAGGGGGGGYTSYNNMTWAYTIYSSDIHVTYGGNGGGYIGGRTPGCVNSNSDDSIAKGGGQNNSFTNQKCECGNKHYDAGFGYGGYITNYSTCSCDTAGGGSGWYGGAAGYDYADAGAGGSGYIANSLLLANKGMYMYNYNSTYTTNICYSSTAANTKTTCTSNKSSTATTNYAKQGNGYARITRQS